MQRSAPYRPPLLRRPSAASSANTPPGRCPFLGTPADPGTSLAFASEANHCFRSRFPVPISSIHQESYCLSAQYATCPVFKQFEAEEENGAVVPLTALTVGAGMAAGAATAAWAAEGEAAAAPFTLAPFPSPKTPAPVAPPPAPAPAFAPAEPVYPDFPMDPGPDPSSRPARRPTSGVNGRAVLAGVALLLLLALAGWAWLNFLSNRGGAGDTAGGTVVALPSLAATIDLGDGVTGISAIGAAAEQTATALAVPAAATGATADSTDQAAASPEAGDAALDSVAATATALFSGAVVAAECGPPDWWVVYAVQPGDTVEALALSRGILPEELIVANCLTQPALAEGQQLFLPPVGVIVLLPGLATSMATLAPTPTMATSILPTRAPIVFPSPTFPLVIVVPTGVPNVEETLEPTRGAPPQRTPVVPATAQPTVPGVASPQPSRTPPGGGVDPTQTPPGIGATRTPPGIGVTPSRTPPGAEPTPSRTPPALP